MVTLQGESQAGALWRFATAGFDGFNERTLWLADIVQSVLPVTVSTEREFHPSV